MIIKSGQVVPRDELIDLFWGKDSFPSNRTVDNYIVKFRKWTDTSDGEVEIQNIRGVGYKFLEKGKKLMGLLIIELLVMEKHKCQYGS